MAYILGIFSADGSMTVNRRGSHYIAFQAKDLDLIEFIKAAMNSKHKIKRRLKEGHSTYRIQIGSKEMCEDLLRLGFSTNKVRTLQLPKMPKKFLPDFVRGYFDGDGNVWTGFIHKGRNTSSFAIQTVFTSCSGDFLRSLKNVLTLLGLKKGCLRNVGTFYR